MREAGAWRVGVFFAVAACFAVAAASGAAAVWEDVPPKATWRTAATAGIAAATILLVAGLYNLLFWRPGPAAPGPASATGNTIDEKRLERLDAHIKFEFELTSARVTYLAISEAFLFGAYATTLAAFRLTPNQELAYSDTLKLLVRAVPWIGVIVAGAVGAAVVCAISMIFKLKAARERLEGDPPGVHPDIGWKSLEHFVGLLPPLVLSVGFFVAWLCVWPPP